jgi:hypothetical protein
VQGITKLTQKFNITLRQTLALMIVFSLVVPQNLFANPAGGDGTNVKVELAPERLDFNKALTPAEMNEIGIEDGSVYTLNTTGELNGMKVDLDVIRGQFKAEDADKLVKVLQQLEPEIRSAYELDPNTKFMFVYVADEKEKQISIQAKEILDLLSGINKNVSVTEEKIKFSTAEKLRKAFSSVFDKTSKSDLYWSLARFAGGGTSATLSFHLGSGLPLPVSLFLGYAVLGAGSAGVGLFIEKYTGWLVNNAADPSRGIKNYLGSVETYMFLSPVLIGLQSTGVLSVEGAALIGGTVGGATLVQSAYYTLKKRFPKVAMWYKWYATEALFLTIPYLIAPSWDIYAENILTTIQSTFLTALFSTMSQGVWDVLLTDKIRAPLLQEAMKKDVMNLSERLSGSRISDEKFSDIVLDHKANHEEEFKVRQRFKKFYFLASFVSVSSAVATNTGVYMGMHALKIAGISGLTVLGLSGAVTWAYVKYKNYKASKARTTNVVDFVSKKSEPILACSLLFSM